MMAPRRKKWTEAEERTLIDKYGDMLSNGTLSKMKTREKKFRPIAYHVNSMHHVCDPVMYPWQWSWKDVSVKVQNMRHQYLLVKQKVQKPDMDTQGRGDGEEFNWIEGLTYWSNFLRYKEVFGDVMLVYNGGDLVVIGNDVNENDDVGFVRNGEGVQIMRFEQMGHLGDGDFATRIEDADNGVEMSHLGFEYEGDENYRNINSHDNDYHNDERVNEDGDDGFGCQEHERNSSNTPRKKMKNSKGCGFLSNQLRQIKEMEARFAQREAEREQERQRREILCAELDQEREQKWEQREKRREEQEKAREVLRERSIREWEAMEKESEENERRRREDVLVYEREWEDRMNRRRSEWKKTIDDTLNQHRAEMEQTQIRIVHEQQNLTSHLIGIVAQCTTGHTGGISDHTNVTTHYFSQMMQNAHHVNGMVHGDARVDEEVHRDDQFIVHG